MLILISIPIPISNSFLFLVVWPGAPSSILAPSSDALCPQLQLKFADSSHKYVRGRQTLLKGLSVIANVH